ncbi:MAG: hypothetical protein P8099_19760, partial [Gemmatimonadota bacterium]
DPGTAHTLDRAPRSPTLGDPPSGERVLGKAAIEPAYDDVTGSLIYILTPEKAPLPTHANKHAIAPLYIVAYPPGSTVGTLNCQGVPGNCPDHDGLIAGIATDSMPSVYGTDPTAVPGHDHLLAPPASGGDFNIAWEVIEVLFTSNDAAKNHLTTAAQIQAAIQQGDAKPYDLGISFDCAVVPSQSYWHGKPIG